MIKSFRHAGIKRFFETGSKAGIQPKHAKRLRLQLARLDAATIPGDMDLPGWHFHPLNLLSALLGRDLAAISGGRLPRKLAGGISLLGSG